MPKADGGFGREGRTQRNPAVTPQTQLTATQEGHLLVFGLHEGAIGRVINQHEVLLAVFDTGVRTGCR